MATVKTDIGTDFQCASATHIEIANISDAPIKVQLYRVNQWITIPNGDTGNTIDITVTESEEIAYYGSLAKGGELTAKIVTVTSD